MAKYILKSALVAEIERRVKLNDTCQKVSGGNEFYRGAIDEAKEIISLIDTLEAKEIGVDVGDPKGDKSAKYIIDTKTLEVREVDLDKETTHYLLYEHHSPFNEIMHKADLKSEMQYHKDIENAFKTGFELGISVSNKAQKGEEV